MLHIIQNRKNWLSISGILFVAAIFFISIWGLRFGIDFTGGSLLEVNFLEQRPTVVDAQNALADIGLSSLSIQPAEETGMILRFQETDEETHQAVLLALNKLAGADEANLSANDASPLKIESADVQIDGASGDQLVIETTSTGELSSPKLEELRFDSVGPSIGQELKSKSFNSMIIVIAIIIIYIAIAFRKVSKPVASWKYGLAGIVAVFHDVIITIGVFAVLGHYFGVEINTPFVAAILTIIGYSINDTIVVFDRTRENLPKSELDFENTVNVALNQTIARSMNTSFTTLLPLIAILVFGGASIQSFALALAIGIFFGAYSSIFVASPLLVVWEKMKNKE